MTRQLEFKIDLADLYKGQFGVGTSVATDRFIDRLGNVNGGIPTIADSRILEHTTRTGIPVWDIVSLEPVVESGTGEKFPGYSFPAEMTITANRAKKIVETEIVAMEGDVEELVALGDWELSFKGFIINYDDMAYPETEVSDLKRACSLKEVNMPVVSEFLNLLGVNWVSIHELYLPQLAGYSNVQPFEIQVKSKRPFNLELIDGIVL